MILAHEFFEEAEYAVQLLGIEALLEDVHVRLREEVSVSEVVHFSLQEVADGEADLVWRD